MDAVMPSEGWGVLHLFFTIDRERAAAEPGAAKRVVDAIAALEGDGHQALVSASLGHKADLGIMALGPDLARLQAFQVEVASVPALSLTSSFVSLTEISEYQSTEEQERERLAQHEGLDEAAIEARVEAWRTRMAKYREDKLHPRLPLKRLICFYPMAKRRKNNVNWYQLPFDERRRLMGGHARVGMSYAGRVLQLITSSFAFDDWEWGVTLLADDPVALKEILYEMRFDEVSAVYSDFGPFIVGLLAEPAEAVRRAGLA
ncbi:MAG TPA: chlorite dismutase family protein [Acidimicrobiia bacterium]|nr:chlorite dismutase family protein [Acidimicrobiia bacterium]